MMILRGKPSKNLIFRSVTPCRVVQEGNNFEGDLTREKVMRARLNPTVLVPACSSSRLTQKVITNLEKVKRRMVRMWTS